MIRLLTLALSSGLLLASAEAQTLTTNAQGQRVIVYEDGTTKLFGEAAPDSSDAPEAPPAVAPAPTPTYTNELPPPAATVSGQSTPEEEADAVLEVRRRVARLTEERDALNKIAKKARSREAKLANRLRKLRDSEKVSDRAQIEIVNQQFLEAREASRTAEEGSASVESRAEALRLTMGMSIAQRRAHLNSLGLGYLLADGDLQNGSDSSPSPPSPAQSSGSPAATMPDAPTLPPTTPVALATDTRPAPTTDFARYDRARDTRYTPPGSTCAREFDGIDEFTNKERVVLAPETFFAYTSPDLKPFLKDASLITCRARLLRTGKTIVLETTFVIRSQFASKEFGVLPKGSQMTFKSIGGQQLSLKNQLQSQAEYDPVAKVSTYRGRYLLSRGAKKFLEEALLDEVRVMWGTGFDDYDVYDLTFLQRQLECIQS